MKVNGLLWSCTLLRNTIGQIMLGSFHFWNGSEILELKASTSKCSIILIISGHAFSWNAFHFREAAAYSALANVKGHIYANPL